MFFENEAPKVSVLVSVYNAGHTIEKCLDSICNQTIDDIEIICLDDGSEDNSIQLMKAYEKKKDNIHVYHQAHLGYGKTRNWLLMQASGQFVAFIDGKDWYPSNDILSVLYSAAVNNGVKISGGSLCGYAEDKYMYHFSASLEGYTFSQNGIFDYSDYQFDYGFQRFIYDRIFLLENSINFPENTVFEDVPFFVHAMCKAKKIYATSKITYCYRNIDNSSIQYSETESKDFFDSLKKALDLSSNYQMAKLHFLLIQRYTNYTRHLYHFASKFSDRFFDELLMIEQTIDHQLLQRISSDITSDYFYRIFVKYQLSNNVFLNQERDNLLSEKHKLLKDIKKLKKENGSLKQKLDTAVKAREAAEKTRKVITTHSDMSGNQIELLQTEIDVLTSSTTFKVGKMIMYIPTHIKDYLIKKKQQKEK